MIAILGLDDRPQARANLVVAARAVMTSYTPPQLATIYRMPMGTDGTGQPLAIIELGGGFAPSDLRTYFGGLGIPVPSIRAVGVDGAKNVPGKDPQGADGEVLLDNEVAGGIAPKASPVMRNDESATRGIRSGSWLWVLCRFGLADPPAVNNRVPPHPLSSQSAQVPEGRVSSACEHCRNGRVHRNT